MSITRKMLKGMGLSEEQQDTILEAHGEQVEGLQAQVQQARQAAERAEQLEQQLQAAQAELEAAKQDGWKDRHDALQRQFDQYKAEVAAKESQAQKLEAARRYYQGKHITGKALEIAIRGSGAEIGALELEDGKIKDASALDALVQGDFAGLVSQTQVRGAEVENPPPAPSEGRQANSQAARIAADYIRDHYGETRKEN